ncbi:FAD synthetase family protein [Treponema sp.]
MKIIDWNDLASGSYKNDTPISSTIGVFDGIHLGHKVLLDAVLETATSKGYTSTVITFKENPKAIMHRRSYHGDVLSLSQKLEILQNAGMDMLILIDFSGDFSRMGGKEFIGLLRDRGNLRYLAVGSDFRCGHNLDTDAQAIQAMNSVYGIPTEIVPPVLKEGSRVSSSKIRTAIVSGDLVEAAALLGRNLEIDLIGAPSTPGEGWTAFDVGSIRRITPPSGRYPVILMDCSTSERTECTIRVEDGVVFVPFGIGAYRVEFIA